MKRLVIALFLAPLLLTACGKDEPTTESSQASTDTTIDETLEQSTTKVLEQTEQEKRESAATTAEEVTQDTELSAAEVTEKAIVSTAEMKENIAEQADEIKETVTGVAEEGAESSTVAVTATMDRESGIALAKKSGCLACHSIENKVVGPAWNDVSARYKDDAGAKAQLVEKVKKGGKGNWTEVTNGVPMPPYSPRVSDKDIETLVGFVLSLAK